MLKEIIPTTVKMKIKSQINKEDKFRCLDKNRKKIIIALAADYGNLGDVAITYAQKKFLQTHFKEYQIVEFYTNDIVSNMQSLKRKITPVDIITIIGGGNMGDLYQYYEDERKFVVNEFRKNLVIMFPQTVDFSDTKSGKKSQKESAQIYNKHNNLIIYARERASFDKLKNMISKNIVYELPDIVLSLDESDNKEDERKNVIICLRNDKEKSLKDNVREEIEIKIKQKFEDSQIMYRDTHIGNIEIEKKEEDFFKILKDFKRAKIVITDRLHGMIFCAITKTPCIAFNNSNGKVKLVYERWLKSLEHIKVIDEYNSQTFSEILDKTMNVKNRKMIDKRYFEKAYEQIKERI